MTNLKKEGPLDLDLSDAMGGPLTKFFFLYGTLTQEIQKVDEPGLLANLDMINEQLSRIVPALKMILFPAGATDDKFRKMLCIPESITIDPAVTS